MDDPATPPLVFANRVIRLFADHLLGADILVEPRDYQIMRLIYRKLGGKWVDLMEGNIVQMVLLEKIVTRWGKQPNRKRQTEDV